MAEEGTEKKEAPAKGKGKLPIIIVMVLMLAAGGFFGMKAAGGDKKEEPKVELGEIVPVKEFIVNLSGPGNTWLKAEVALQFAKGVDAKHTAQDYKAVIEDAITMTLRAKTLQQVRTLDGTRALKREIAAAINLAIDAAHGHADAPEKGEEHKHEDGKKEEKPEPKHPDWDSDKGPVLKVFFTSFATQ